MICLNLSGGGEPSDKNQKNLQVIEEKSSIVSAIDSVILYVCAMIIKGIIPQYIMIK